MTPRACPTQPALQMPPPVQPPSCAQRIADQAHSRPRTLFHLHTATRSGMDPDTLPSPGLHAPSPLIAADNAAAAAAANSCSV